MLALFEGKLSASVIVVVYRDWALKMLNRCR
jgi:hypothetical protein